MPPLLSMPLAGEPRISQGFSPVHTGVDWFVPTGTPVLAAGAGKVTNSGWLVGGGLLGGGLVITIDHGGDLETVYAHLATAFVRKGVLVRAGQQIALSGASGLVTGPHLHFEIKVNGKHLDPILYLRGKPLPGEGELDLRKLDIDPIGWILDAAIPVGLNLAIVAVAVAIGWAGARRILAP